MVLGVRDEAHAEALLVTRDHSQRGAVDANRPLLYYVAHDLRRCVEARYDRKLLRRKRGQPAGVLHHATHEMTAKTPGEGKCALEVHLVADFEVAEVGSFVGLFD